jgi:hypothetical protein
MNVLTLAISLFTTILTSSALYMTYQSHHCRAVIDLVHAITREQTFAAARAYNAYCVRTSASLPRSTRHQHGKWILSIDTMQQDDHTLAVTTKIIHTGNVIGSDTYALIL